MTAKYIDCQLRKEVERKLQTNHFYLETFASNEESIAATRLYHAAPDLLDALTDLFNDVMYLGIADECNDSFQKASRAIDKALGVSK